jgi:hypothetical protein
MTFPSLVEMTEESHYQPHPQQMPQSNHPMMNIPMGHRNMLPNNVNSAEHVHEMSGNPNEHQQHLVGGWDYTLA